MKLREMIASAVGFDPEQSQFADGKITNGTRSATLHEATAGGRLTAEESIEFGTLSKEYQQSTFAGILWRSACIARREKFGSGVCSLCVLQDAS